MEVDRLIDLLSNRLSAEEAHGALRDLGDSSSPLSVAWASLRRASANALTALDSGAPLTSKGSSGAASGSRYLASAAALSQLCDWARSLPLEERPEAFRNLAAVAAERVPVHSEAFVNVACELAVATAAAEGPLAGVSVLEGYVDHFRRRVGCLNAPYGMLLECMGQLQVDGHHIAEGQETLQEGHDVLLLCLGATDTRTRRCSELLAAAAGKGFASATVTPSNDVDEFVDRDPSIPDIARWVDAVYAGFAHQEEFAVCACFAGQPNASAAIPQVVLALRRSTTPERDEFAQILAWLAGQSQDRTATPADINAELFGLKLLMQAMMRRPSR